MDLNLVYKFLPALLSPQNHCTALPPSPLPRQISPSLHLLSRPRSFSVDCCIAFIVLEASPSDILSTADLIPLPFILFATSHTTRIPPPPCPLPPFPLHRRRRRRCPTSVPDGATSSNARRRNASCSSIRSTHVPFERRTLPIGSARRDVRHSATYRPPWGHVHGNGNKLPPLPLPR